MVRIIMGVQKRIMGLLVGSMMILVLLTGGDYIFDNPMFTKATNLYHIPQEVVDVCRVMEPDEEEDWVMAAVPAEMLSFVRQYSTRIHMPYGRAVLIDRWNLGHPMYETMEAEVIDTQILAEQAKEYECDYIVLAEHKETSGDLEEYGFNMIDTIDGYNIFRFTEKLQED